MEEVNFFSYKMDCNNVLQNEGKKANITWILEGASWACGRFMGLLQVKLPLSSVAELAWETQWKSGNGCHLHELSEHMCHLTSI